MRSPLLRRVTLGCSLVLCLAVAVLWVRSYWIVDTFSWCSRLDDHLVASAGGRIAYGDARWPNGRVVVRLRHDAARRNGPAWFERPDHVDGFRFIGFEYSKEALPRRSGRVWLSFYVPPWRLLAIPYGAVLALALIHPAARWMAWGRRKGRRRRGLCVQCGYDLRASGARCPECGRAV